MYSAGGRPLPAEASRSTPGSECAGAARSAEGPRGERPTHKYGEKRPSQQHTTSRLPKRARLHSQLNGTPPTRPPAGTRRSALDQRPPPQTSVVSQPLSRISPSRKHRKKTSGRRGGGAAATHPAAAPPSPPGNGVCVAPGTDAAALAAASLIPPRTGKRRKVEIVPAFNMKNAFQLVRVRSLDKFGIRAPAVGSPTALAAAGPCEVYLEQDVHPSFFAQADVVDVTLAAPSRHAYTEEVATIGGIGKHVRWKIIPAIPHFHENVSMYIRGIENRVAFRALTVSLSPFVMCGFEYTPDADDDSTPGLEACLIHVSDGKHVGIVGGYYHRDEYTVSFATEYANNRAGKLGLERYDRSGHMWWNQPKATAGPLRDTHRWRFPFLPAEWLVLPFTWETIAANLLTADVQHLPLPLRNYVVEAQRQQAAGAETPPSQCAAKVTARLSLDQNRQLLSAAYWSSVAPIDEQCVELSHLLQFRYLLHGYVGREIGDYRQNALHVGHGAYIRKFKNKAQYDPSHISTAVMNKIAQPNGELRGSGFKGTRGKYGHEDFPKYNAKRSMTRDLVDDMKIVAHVPNAIQDYGASVHRV